MAHGLAWQLRSVHANDTRHAIFDRPRKTLRILVKRRMAPRIRTSGCLLSIIASVVLTVALNLLLRACMG